MALHDDDPQRSGNLSDEEYWAAAEARGAQAGACHEPPPPGSFQEYPSEVVAQGPVEQIQVNAGQAEVVMTAAEREAYRYQVDGGGQ